MCIRDSVNAAPAQRVGRLEERVHLERRLPAGEGHAAVLPEERPPRFHLLHDLAHADLFADPLEGRIAPSLDAGMVLAARADGAVEPAVVDRAVRATPRREGALLRVCLLYTSPSPRDRT